MGHYVLKGIMNKYILVILASAFMAASTLPSLGDEAAATNAVPEEMSRREMMTDPEDGKFDVSAWLATAKGFLPVPIIITEPAIGYGGGLVLLFFHDSIKNRAEQVKERNPDGTPKRLPPPSITGVAGFGTENGTWGGGLFHMGIWKDDTIRYMGALAYASINYDYYPSPDLDASIPITIEGGYLLQQLMFRIGDSDFFAGGNYTFSSSTAKADVSLPPPAGNGVEFQSGGASGILEYDSRDNLFTPDKGYNSKGEFTHYDTWLGSDNEFDIFKWNNRAWHPLGDMFVLGARLDTDFTGGDIPFYMRPYVDIRGIPAMRYQGDYVVTAETELRWDVTPRWSLIGFLGAGWTADDSLSNLSDSETYPAVGFGFRYLVARVFNMRAGLDFGFSEAGNSFYITTGSAWGR